MVENHHNLQAQIEFFLYTLRLYPQGVLKEIHSLVRDGTDRKQVKHKMIEEINVSYYPIRYKKDLKTDMANHVAYATYATT